MVNDRQKQMITYLLINYGTNAFTIDDWRDALTIVFSDIGGFPRAMYRCTISTFKENGWLVLDNDYRYGLTRNAIMQLGKSYD